MIFNPVRASRTPKCARCGSGDNLMFDAWARWDSRKGEFVAENIDYENETGYAFCFSDECDNEDCEIIWGAPDE